MNLMRHQIFANAPNNADRNVGDQSRYVRLRSRNENVESESDAETAVEETNDQQQQQTVHYAQMTKVVQNASNVSGKTSV
jgi:hypothetical protein